MTPTADGALAWCKWSSDTVSDSQLSGHRFESDPGHFQPTESKLLTYCVFGPTRPPTLCDPTRLEKWVLAYGLWLIGAVKELHSSATCES